jgi:hypothetical protein
VSTYDLIADIQKDIVQTGISNKRIILEILEKLIKEGSNNAT